MLAMRRTIVLFGDSITQTGFSTGANFAGWAGLLANSYARRADVLNRGFSGYNTRHALDALPSVFGSVEGRSSVGRPLFVTVLLGANDSSLPGDGEHCQHVPVDEYEDNLKKIVDAIECAFEGGTPKPPIILITPPPVDAPSWDQYCMDAFGELAPRTNEVARLYGERVKSVARASSCSVVDAFSLLGGNGSEEEYGRNLEDGLHLNESGNKLLHEGLMALLSKEFPHLWPMEDGDGKYGKTGIPLEGALWKELC